MRRGVLVGGAVGAFNAGLALLLVWWFGRRPTQFGWYSYSPMPRRYSDYVAITPRWEIIAVTVGAFLVANMAIGVVLARRRRRANGLPG